MERLFMEESAMKMKMRMSGLSVMNNNYNCINASVDGFVFNPCHRNSFVNVNNMNMMSNEFSFGRSPLPPLYSSLPISIQTSQPPLLPLPSKLSATLASSANNMITIRSSSPVSSGNSRTVYRKKSKKKKQQIKSMASTAPKMIEAEATKKPIILARGGGGGGEEEKEEIILVGLPETLSTSSESVVYSLSPPPSSVPLPRLLLMTPCQKARVNAIGASSCIVEAMINKGGVVGVDAGATDDLCKLLRL